jgi:hypothetical protein
VEEATTTKLIAAAAALGVTAAIGAVFMFATKNKDPREGKLHSIDVSDLRPGFYKTKNTDALRYFIIRPEQGDVYVLAVPLVEGNVPMPETHWWKPIIRCKSFGVESEVSINDGAKFVCRDAGQPEQWAKRWQWDMHGKHIPDAENTPIDDLYRVRVERSGDVIVLVGLDSD